MYCMSSFLRFPYYLKKEKKSCFSWMPFFKDILHEYNWWQMKSHLMILPAANSRVRCSKISHHSFFLWVKSCFSRSWFGVMELQVCSRGGVDNLSIRPFGITEYYLLLFLWVRASTRSENAQHLLVRVYREQHVYLYADTLQSHFVTNSFVVQLTSMLMCFT